MMQAGLVVAYRRAASATAAGSSQMIRRDLLRREGLGGLLQFVKPDGPFPDECGIVQTGRDDLADHGHGQGAVVPRFDLQPDVGHRGQSGPDGIDDDQFGALLSGGKDGFGGRGTGVRIAFPPDQDAA